MAAPVALGFHIEVTNFVGLLLGGSVMNHTGFFQWSGFWLALP